MPAKRECLAERQPALASKSVLDHRAPENEDVDATILPGRRSVLGLGEGCPRRRRSPRLDPGHVARLQLSDDLVGYFVIEIRPALAGARPNNMSRHRGLRDGRREPFSRLPTRHGQPGRHSHSWRRSTRSKRSNFGERFREGRVRDGSPKGEDPASTGPSAKPTARPAGRRPRTTGSASPTSGCSERCQEDRCRCSLYAKVPIERAAYAIRCKNISLRCFFWGAGDGRRQTQEDAGRFRRAERPVAETFCERWYRHLRARFLR